ncbi:response regulator [Bacteroides fragilis]|uniref:ATP-binding response regulator n=1 Tax=Bacteroides fragilis TaxID=817 RepID=UPI00202F4080|nr:ATP-binding protein [Bacteroides fragilis]MCM0238795.1 response regulator [Bacteroides fragilis]
MIQARLKLKIIIGYLIWVSFFVLIIHIVHDSRQKKSVMEQQEAHWQGERQQTDQAFLSLLGLASTGELIAGWTEEDYAAYQEKRVATVTLLQNLKAGQEDSLQRACIDSVCILLIEKETKMAAVLQLLENMPDAGEIVHRKIPVVVSQNKVQAARQENTPVVETSEKKKKNFWSFFRKQEKKSAYARQREKARKEPTPATTSGTGTAYAAVKPSALLYSIEKEIDNATHHYEESLSAKMDSLRVGNRILNGHINLLVQNFERKERETFCREIRWQQETRTHTFRLIAGIGVVAFVLVILLYMVIHRDVNRQYQIRTKLEESNRRNEELLRARKNMMLTVSHDLRSPLTAIGGYAELIPGERRKEKRIRYSEAIRQSAERMLYLLNTLLRFYRLDTGKEQPNPVPFHLKALVESLVPNYTLLAENKQLAFAWEYIGDDVVVTGDRERLSQIIDNLLSNAVKFTQAGTVSLRLHYRDALLTIEVKDTGTGMTDRQLQRIFQPFERLGNAGEQEGFGLGLAITLGTAGLLGGSIRVESEKGKGSVFTVCVPLPVTDEQHPMPPTHAPCVLPDNLHIAVVDDDPVLLAMTTDMLSRNDLSCNGCRNVHDLMELLRKHSYDLLITDLRMPDMDGYQLLELLRRSNVGNSKTIPVLAATARADRNTEAFTEAGFAGCLYKPFSQTELLTAVQNCIRPEQMPEAPAKADFSALLSGERNNREMLELLADETARNMAALEACIGNGDLQRVSFLTHHLLPLGELVREYSSLKNLQRLLDTSPGTMDGEMVQAIRKVVEEGNSVIRQARALIEEQKEE